MNRKLFYFSLVGLAISACSNINNKQAAGGFEYAEKSEPKELVIPQALEKPKDQKKFFVNNDVNNAGPTGQKMDIRAPTLVLPIAASTRVESNSGEAKVWFDQVLDDKDLQLYIYQSLEKQLASDGVTLNAIVDESQVFESDWFHSENTTGFWVTESVESAQSMRFRYQFESKPHGRSVSLKVTMIDYMRTDDKGSTKLINPIDQERAEMTMLNQIIEQVDYQYRLQQRENRLLRASQKMVTIGESKLDEPAYLVEMERDLLWSNMPIFFEDYGFIVTDIDESKYIYFVDFVKPDNSFWDSIWGEDTPIIDVADAKYQFVLGEMGLKTSVTIFDADGNVLPAETLENILPVMELGLSFRDAL